MPISSIFEIGKRSLLAYQSAIQTTSGNVANVNNEDYNRRRAQLNPLLNGFSAIGISGQDSVRLSQQYAQYQLWQENQRLGEYESRNTMLRQVENVFAENTDSGINSLLTDFWNSWNGLANDPDSDYARNLVRDKAVLLSGAFQRVHADFKDMQNQIRPEIKAHIDEINQKTQQLAKINERLTIENNPDLMDQRDRLITDLSKLVDIKVKEDDKGVVSIYTDGLLMVSKGEYNEMRMSVDSSDSQNRVHIYLGQGQRELNIQSGSLKSLIDINNNKIPGYLDKLDELARSIADEVNGLHSSGENLNGTTGISFFADDVSGAADFRVNDAIIQDASLIASHYSGEGEGSGSLAQDISDLRNQRLVHGVSINDYYNTMLSDIGNNIQEASFLEDSQQLVVQQIQNQKDAVSGVSLDEEMANLVQYQQAYQAAARIVTTVNDMVDTVLSLK